MTKMLPEDRLRLSNEYLNNQTTWCDTSDDGKNLSRFSTVLNKLIKLIKLCLRDVSQVSAIGPPPNDAVKR